MHSFPKESKYIHNTSTTQFVHFIIRLVENYLFKNSISLPYPLIHLLNIVYHLTNKVLLKRNAASFETDRTQKIKTKGLKISHFTNTY